MDRTRLGLVALVLVVTLAGCASLGSSGDGGAPAPAGGDGGGDLERSGDGARGGSDGGGDGAADSSGSAGALAALDRSIVRTGSVDVTVESYEQTRNALGAETRRFDGYVGGSSQTLHESDNETWTTGQVVLRVPTERFDDLLSFAKQQGTVESVETETEDVTDRLVELDARLTNLEEKRNRLRAFYDRANSTNELLAIEERLSSVQGEIERLQAKQRALEDRVAYSTLRVGIHETPPDSTDEPPRRSTVLGAFLGSVDRVIDGGYTLLVGLAAAAPFALVFGVPAVIGYGLYRRLGISPIFGAQTNRAETVAEPAYEADEPDDRQSAAEGASPTDDHPEESDN